MKFVLLLPIFFVNLALAIPPDLRALRDNARMAVRKSHCAKCHAPSMAPKAKALKVFNLALKDWSSTMTDANLERLRWALKDATPAEIRAMGADPKENKLDKSDIKTIMKFVDREMRFRQKNPNHRFKDIQRQENPELFKILNVASPNSDSECVL